MGRAPLKDLEKNKFINRDTQEPIVRVQGANGFQPNTLAKYVEAVYTNSNMTVTYNYYESSSKATLYNTVSTTYSTAQCTEFSSAEWD
jgi:hypothetical protein